MHKIRVHKSVTSIYQTSPGGISLKLIQTGKKYWWLKAIPVPQLLSPSLGATAIFYGGQRWGGKWEREWDTAF